VSNLKRKIALESGDLPEGSENKSGNSRRAGVDDFQYFTK
jgi:hypothetical protein